MKEIVTALGLLLLGVAALLAAEERRRWIPVGLFAAGAILCLVIGKGKPWTLAVALVAAGLAVRHARSRKRP